MRTNTMYEKHLKSVAEMCEDNNLVLMWRPINAAVSEKYSQGYVGKALNTKGKSSEYGPIAGDIPVDARLSKLSAQADLAKVQKDTQYFTDMNRTVIETAREKMDRLREEGKLGTPDEYNEFNEQNYVTSVGKRVELEGISGEFYLYYVTEGDNEVVFEEVNGRLVPKFYAMDPNSKENIWKYNYEDNRYEQVPDPQTELGDARLERVEILAYCYYRKLDDGQYVEEQRPVTADYDELTSSAQTFFPMLAYYPLYPLENNQQNPVESETKDEGELKDSKEQEMAKKTTYVYAPRISLNESMLTQLSVRNFCSLLTNQDPIDRVAGIAMEHYLTDRTRFYTPELRESMGKVNEIQWAIKVAQKNDTEGATNHGPEVNNPKPESFVGGVIYLVNLPPLEHLQEQLDRVSEEDKNWINDHIGDITTEDGNTLHYLALQEATSIDAEKSICRFINILRSIGYPLPVNPRWEWRANADGLLSVPEGVRRDWIHDMEEHLKLKHKDPAFQNEEKQAGENTRLEILEQIKELMLEIESLRVEPRLVYGQPRKEMVEGVLPTPMDYQQYRDVCDRTELLHRRYLADKIVEKKGELETKIEQYIQKDPGAFASGDFLPSEYVDNLDSVLRSPESGYSRLLSQDSGLPETPQSGSAMASPDLVRSYKEDEEAPNSSTIIDTLPETPQSGSAHVMPDRMSFMARPDSASSSEKEKEEKAPHSSAARDTVRAVPGSASRNGDDRRAALVGEAKVLIRQLREYPTEHLSTWDRRRLFDFNNRKVADLIRNLKGVDSMKLGFFINQAEALLRELPLPSSQHHVSPRK